MLVRIEAKVQKVEGKKIVLGLEDGQELFVQKDLLGEVNLGDVFSVQIMPETEAALEREELSRTILNQLLNDK